MAPTVNNWGSGYGEKTTNMNNMERDNGVSSCVFTVQVLCLFKLLLYFPQDDLTFIAGVWDAGREPDAAKTEHEKRIWINQC